MNAVRDGWPDGARVLAGSGRLARSDVNIEFAIAEVNSVPVR
jgi:hypothetical protein